MPLLLIAVWFLGLGLIVFLAVEAVGHRLSERREKKAAARRLSELKKHSRSDRRPQERTRQVDGVVGSSRAGVIFRRGLALFGLLVLVLWELYWGSEVAEAQDWSQIPHFFLFLVMIVIPGAAYLLSRGVFRRPVSSTSDR